MADTVETRFDIRIKHIFALAFECHVNRTERIMGTPPRPKAVAVRLEAGFPFRFKCLFDEGLYRTVEHGGDA